MKIANAGHLPPYINGVDVDCDSSLPLGLAHGIKYPETLVHLAPHARVTVLSDGVIEARTKKSSELFGFERTEAISAQSASAIAAQAKRFGQEDDITVVTLDWSANPYATQ